MTVTTNKPAQAGAVAKASKTDVKVPGEAIQIPLPNRREFLFYCWGASLALFTAASGGAIIWFMLPRFKEGEFGGIFRESSVPDRGDSPLNNATGKYWLSHAEDGLVALYKVCTHLGCLYAWVENSFRFECPCHGSKFELNGLWIEGPAPRSLDRFSMTVKLTSGAELVTNATGDPIAGIDPSQIAEVIVDTGSRIKRAGRV